MLTDRLITILKELNKLSGTNKRVILTTNTEHGTVTGKIKGCTGDLSTWSSGISYINMTDGKVYGVPEGVPVRIDIITDDNDKIVLYYSNIIDYKRSESI